MEREKRNERELSGKKRAKVDYQVGGTNYLPKQQNQNKLTKTLFITFSVGGSQFLADLCFSGKSGFCGLGQILWLIEKLVKGLS